MSLIDREAETVERDSVWLYDIKPVRETEKCERYNASLWSICLSEKQRLLRETVCDCIVLWAAWTGLGLPEFVGGDWKQQSALVEVKIAEMNKTFTLLPQSFADYFIFNFTAIWQLYSAIGRENSVESTFPLAIFRWQRLKPNPVLLFLVNEANKIYKCFRRFGF